MGKVPTQIHRRKQRLPRKYAKRDEVLANKFEDFQMSPLDTQHLLISALLPADIAAR